jgi:hypothetical protein
LTGLGVVGLFSLVIIGRFFGELTNTNAALLFFAPLLSWLPEVPPMRRLRPAIRTVLAVILVAVPLAIAVNSARIKFIENSERTAPNSDELTPEDYLNFGK